MVEGSSNIHLELSYIENEIGTLSTSQGTTGISSNVASNPNDGTWQTLIPQLQQNMKDWSTNIMNAIYVGHFFVIDDGSKVNLNVGQNMHRIVCHSNGTKPISS
jgi:hypothetical protein